jgi:transcriptional regulator of acetoin/glycerol metabolism
MMNSSEPKVRCRNCEYLQPTQSVCRRCGQPLPQQVAGPTARVVERIVERVVEVETKVPVPVALTCTACGHVCDEIPTLENSERALVAAAMEKAGNVQGAAKLLGLSKTSAYRKLQEFGIAYKRD